ncbi:MAG: flagellar basal body rod protein FlgB [Gammaproteobacteria bacterium]|nr:flagellar basal body rod protein FlgB [Gammaproteobacteria bacterium]NNJ96643.1 flagellar basal body rod protein FlgB [Gammaproteobacteria bacterium]
MPISFDSALGNHDKALLVRSRRAELLASNIANVDTPGYKARDIDFKTTFESIQAQTNQGLELTHKNHIPLTDQVAGTDVLYRIPNQSSLDGNTVDSQLEKSAFAENALRYQASLTFLDRKFKGLIAAFKGE